MSPTGKSFRSSVRACVRAKLRVPARRCCFRGWAIFLSLCSGAPPAAGVPFPAVGLPSLLIAVNRRKSLLNAFPLLPVASRGFPLLPVASRARFRC